MAAMSKFRRWRLALDTELPMTSSRPPSAKVFGAIALGFSIATLWLLPATKHAQESIN